MRILQILPELNVGGVETGTIDFAKYLVEHNHYGIVVSNGGKLVEQLDQACIKHYCLPVHKKSLPSILRCIRLLRQIILQDNIEIVHARSRVPGWIAYFACRKTSAQFITTCHGYYSTHYFSRVMGWAKYIIVPSQVIARHMIDNFAVDPENIRCIPRSVDLDKFTVQHKILPKKKTFIIANIGRLTPLKGHVYFLKAMAKVIRLNPFVKIWIIGDAPRKKESFKAELEVIARRLGLTNYVEFLGTRQDVPQLLAQTDVVVLSSIMPESFGRVILESQAAGVPVVATKVGGVVEIIDHEKTGLMVEPKDPEAMAKAILKLLNDKKLVQQLTAHAKAKINEKYTLQHMCEQTIHVYQELSKSINILVIKISAIGDVILITAALKALRKKYPKAKICCLVGKESRKILARCPYLDELIIIDLKGNDKGFWPLIKFSRKLVKYKFDKVIDFQNNHKSHLLAYLSFAIETYGFRNKKWGFLLNRPVPDPNHHLSPVEHQFQILNLLGINYKKEFFLELWPTKKDYKKIDSLLDEEWLSDNVHIIGINIAASIFWKTKNWPIEHLAKLCDKLAMHNYRVFITGTEQDKEKAQALLKLTKSKPTNFVGKTDILELAAFIKRCSVFISPDSAPMHIAAAMKTPFIAFFGPTDPLRHLPPAQEHFVFRKELECSPCYSRQCLIHTHLCMKEISPDEVFKQIEKIIYP